MMSRNAQDTGSNPELMLSRNAGCNSPISTTLTMLGSEPRLHKASAR